METKIMVIIINVEITKEMEDGSVLEIAAWHTNVMQGSVRHMLYILYLSKDTYVNCYYSYFYRLSYTTTHLKVPYLL